MPMPHVDPHSKAIIFDLTDDEKKVKQLEERLVLLEDIIKNGTKVNKD